MANWGYFWVQLNNSSFLGIILSYLNRCTSNNTLVSMTYGLDFQHTFSVVSFTEFLRLGLQLVINLPHVFIYFIQFIKLEFMVWHLYLKCIVWFFSFQFISGYMFYSSRINLLLDIFQTNFILQHNITLFKSQFILQLRTEISSL